MIEVIPAIDILNGQVVRLIQGDYSRGMTYYKDPVDMAIQLKDHGIRRLHMVDLDGAREKHIVNYKVLERVASLGQLVIDFGGGLKSNDDLRIAFESGASMVTGGSIAVRDPELFLEWLEAYGPEKIILGADFREGKIAVSGWQEGTDEDLFTFVRSYQAKGVTKVICTDISKDGMMQGAAVDSYKRLMENDPALYLVASGGIGSMRDIEVLDEAGIPGVIVGRALYEGKIHLRDLGKYCS